MRVTLALVFGLLAITARADPYFMDGNALYGRLVRQDPTAMAYIFGVYDAVQITQYHAPSAERIICAPPAVMGTELDRRGTGISRGGTLYPAVIQVQ